MWEEGSREASPCPDYASIKLRVSGHILKRIALLYFSGAGNTECIAKIIERIACKHGYIVSRKRITSESIDSLKIDYDILGIGYPIHFRKPPSLVSKFISNLN